MSMTETDKHLAERVIAYGEPLNNWEAVAQELARRLLARVEAQEVTGAEEAKNNIIKIAAELARGDGFPSTYLSDHPIPKMSFAARKYFDDVLTKFDNRLKDVAIHIRQIVDSCGWTKRQPSPIAAAVAGEREACARICDALQADAMKPTDRLIGYEECAEAIRARSNGAGE